MQSATTDGIDGAGRNSGAPRRQRLGRLVASVLVLASAGAAIYYFGGGPRLPTGEESSMVSRVEAQLNSGEQYLHFAEITPFPWDRMFVFPLSATRETVGAAVGKGWTKLDYAVGDSDVRYLIVFERGGDPRVWYKQPLLLDLDNIANGRPIERSRSRFRLIRSGTQWRVEPLPGGAS